MKAYLGIDGGGTATVAAIGSETGEIIFRTSGETINFCAVGMKKARENLQGLISDITGHTGISHFSGACIGCSALSHRADSKLYTELCGGIINSEKAVLDSDLFSALCAAGEGERAILISGTGSMAAGIDCNGNIITKGGWGYILGDGGSGFDIGLSAVKAMLTELDGGKKDSILENAVLDYFGIENIAGLTDVFYNPAIERKKLAAFAEQVFLSSEGGSSIAAEVINTACDSLLKTASALYKEKEYPTLSLYGGVFLHQKSFSKRFIAEFSVLFPGVEIKILETPPEEGALKFAYTL